MPQDLEIFAALIAALYDAVLDPQGISGLALQMARLFDTASCGMQSLDLPTKTTQVFSITSNADEKMKSLYEQHFHFIDPWVAGAMQKPIGAPIIGTDVESEAHLLQSEYYNDWARHNGMFHLLGATTAVDETSIGVVGIHREEGRPAFTEDDKRLLALVMPHFGRCLQLRNRLQGLHHERRLALEAIDALGTGIAVLAPDKRLLFANACATRVMTRACGLDLRGGFLRALRAGDERRLESLVREATSAAMGKSPGSGGMMSLRRADGTRVSLLICPLRPESITIGPTQPMALVFVGDSADRHATPAEALARLYGLTPAESRLTAALLAGESLKDYAASAGITRETARTLLKRVFAKTGQARQADLIRDALANPVLRVLATRGA